MSIDRTIIAHIARNWSRWLPEKTAQLKAERQFGKATQIAVLQAQKMIRELMDQRYQENEAAKVALPLYILLQPEPDADEYDDPELRRKRRKMEARYQEMMRKPAKTGRVAAAPAIPARKFRIIDLRLGQAARSRSRP
jgi:hypothetical protein